MLNFTESRKIFVATIQAVKLIIERLNLTIPPELEVDLDTTNFELLKNSYIDAIEMLPRILPALMDKAKVKKRK